MRSFRPFDTPADSFPDIALFYVFSCEICNINFSRPVDTEELSF